MSKVEREDMEFLDWLFDNIPHKHYAKMLRFFVRHLDVKKFKEHIYYESYWKLMEAQYKEYKKHDV